MKIGVLGGSFNPPTLAHLELSKKCIEQGFCDKVVWVPVNDSYRKSTNIPARNRLDMVKLALKDEKDVGYSKHELYYDRIVRTFESLCILQKYLLNDELFFIAGADKLGFRWMQKEEFISRFGYILVNRGDINCDEIINKSDILRKYRSKINILDFKSDISSTLVRNEIMTKGFSSLISENVMEYLRLNHLYGLKI